MTVEQGAGEANDQFPVGMRVLAVDDDPTCLLLLETLLRRCQYHGIFLLAVTFYCLFLCFVRLVMLVSCFVVWILFVIE